MRPARGAASLVLGAWLAACGGGPEPAPAREARPLVVSPLAAAHSSSAPPATSASTSAAPAPSATTASKGGFIGPPPPAVVAVIEKGNKDLEAVLPLGRLGEPTMHSRGGPVIVTYPRFDASAGPDAPPMGYLSAADPKMGAYYEEAGPEYPKGDIPVAEYVATMKLSPKVIAAATKLPDVGQMCAESKAQGAPCTLWVSRMGKAKCEPGRSPLDECLWEVYLGSNMGSHVSRLATIYVEPVTYMVVAISDLGCPPMTVAGFRKVRAATKAGKMLDTCPDEIKP